MTLNLAQRSYILAAIESSCTTLYVVDRNFRSVFNRFGDIAGFIRPEPTAYVSKYVSARVQNT